MSLSLLSTLAARPVSTLFVLVLASTATACTAGGAAPATDQAVAAAPQATQAAQALDPAPQPTTPPRLRDDDELDVAVLQQTMGAGAVGEQSWIEVMADLRTRSWLATRYPGQYDPADVYGAAWADGQSELIRQSIEEGVYLDEPLPTLVSVTVTRSLGSLTELEVVLDTGEAVLRRDRDDGVVGALPGAGQVRGLFMLGPAEPADPTRPWRIHSIAELAPPSADSTGTSEEDTG